MKLLILSCVVMVSACATRHSPDTTAWFADCYNKQRQESLIARAESRLGDDDHEARRNLRRLYWKLQQECK
jgi:hypothetical protein